MRTFRGYIRACCYSQCEDWGSRCFWEGFLSVEALLHRCWVSTYCLQFIYALVSIYVTGKMRVAPILWMWSQEKIMIIRKKTYMPNWNVYLYMSLHFSMPILIKILFTDKNVLLYIIVIFVSTHSNYRIRNGKATNMFLR